MSLITETGAGLPNAESYCDVATALDYHAARGNSTWSALTTTQQEQALRKATDYMEQVYINQWQGLRISSAQALSWPRTGAIGKGYAVLANIVPVPVIRACAELALRASTSDLLPDTTQQKTRTRVDAIEVEYNPHSSQLPRYTLVDSMLRPYLMCSSSVGRRFTR